MEISGKVFIVIIAFFVGLAIFCVAAYANVGGLGTALAGFGGPIATGLYSIFSAPFKWALSGGWPTLVAGIAIVAALMLASGFLFEQKHVIATIKGTNNTTEGNFQDSPSQTIPVTGLQDAPSDNKK